MSSNESQGVPGTPKQGEIINGRYRIESVLGQGGMGVVLAATDEQLGRRVAIKFLSAAVAGRADIAARFVREARSAAQIRSDHCANILDVGTTPAGSAFMVMEHLEGEDLADRLKNSGPLPIEQAVIFVLQAAEALAEAHAAGIIHRDLKPANLFVTRRADGSDWIKVLDFGIAKVVAGPADDITHTTAFMGSPAYMSPEQCRSAKNADSRSDIWALGIILFQLTTGRYPFGGETATELLSAILSDTPIALSALRPDAPRALEAVIAACLEKRPDDRLQTLRSLAERLAPLGGPRGEQSARFIAGVIGEEGPVLVRDSMAHGSPVARISTEIMAPPVAAVAPAPHEAGLTQVGAGVPPAAATTTGSAAMSRPVPVIPRPRSSRRRPSGSKPLMIAAGATAALFLAGLAVIVSGDDDETLAAPLAIETPSAAPSATASAAPEPELNPFVRIEPPDGERLLGFGDHEPAAKELALTHTLRIQAPRTAYAIQEHEVTWRELDPWLARAPQHAFDLSWAVTNRSASSVAATGMSFSAATAYCASIDARLPTEAEWEYAARGPTLRALPWGSGPFDLAGVHAFLGPDATVREVKRSEQDRISVGDRFLYDMLGNAREWTSTIWIDGHTGQPKEHPQFVYRVVRGYHLDRSLAPRDEAACKRGEAAGCALEGPPQGLGYRSSLCGEGACLDTSSKFNALRAKIRRAVGFRCAR